jgi:hypothetical protein
VTAARPFRFAVQAVKAEHPNVLLGRVDELTDRLIERRETYGVNYVTVQQSAVEAFAPIVTELTGH